MCDYSTESMRQEKVVEGRTYVIDTHRNIHHGFHPLGDPYTAACVSHGMRLAMTDVASSDHADRMFGVKLPKDFTATVVLKRNLYSSLRTKAIRDTPFNDLLLVGDQYLPIAYIARATMRVLPAEKPLEETLALGTIRGESFIDEPSDEQPSDVKQSAVSRLSSRLLSP